MESLAVVFDGPGQVDVRAVRVPDPGPGDVVVRTLTSWISPGTEGSYRRGERVAGDTPWRPGDPAPFPVVAGYQKIGVVEHVGPEADTGVRPGQTVFTTVGRVEGMFEPWGGQVAQSVAPASEVWALPGCVDPTAFAGLVLTQVGWNCGARPALASDAAGAVVLGDGLVGQWAAQTLADRGASVVLVGRRPSRLARFTAGKTALASEWLASPEPVDVVVDAVGDMAAFSAAFSQLRPGGQLVSAGFYGVEDRLPVQGLRASEATVHLVAGWTRPRMDATLAAVAEGRLTTLDLVTHRFPVARAAEAWAAIDDRSQDALGVLLDWEDSGL
jgi:2-desacetyl-2-hydroxyethyl bacteriochlorophyllide A dehydrogenase